VNRAFVATGVPLEGRDLGSHSFLLQVQYPGLLIGLGYAHQSTSLNGDIRGDLALGFSFDYVTGVPYIPGSSVKGVLRNAFTPENRGYVQAFVGDGVDVAQLELEIFGSTREDEDTAGDIFFDVFPSPDTPRVNTDGLCYLLDTDVITPHGEGLSSTPNPLSFVKVKPGVVFDFRFQLHDGMITAAKKRALFKQILKDFGIGAKTNVGFGVLDEVSTALRVSGGTQPAAAQPRRSGSFPQQSPYANNEPTRRNCSLCGRLNYKFKKDSREINANWHTQTCFSCGGKLL